MVSQNSPPDPTNPSSIMHQFIVPNSIPEQTHFPNDPFHPYAATYPHEPPDMSHRSRLMDLLGTTTSHHTPSNPAQRLSLSLCSTSPCSQMISRPFSPTLFNPAGYVNPGPDQVIVGDYPFSGNDNALAALQSFSDDNHRPRCSTSYVQESFADVIRSSRYLRSVQSLLMEMVSVGGEEIGARNRKYVEKMFRAGQKGCYRLPPELKTEFSDSELCACFLKLLDLLEEVERRYEEYYHHMEDLVASFEAVAGLGSGGSYTALALQAMSKHFCNLRHAILAQARAAKRTIERDEPRISSRLGGLSLLDQDAGRRQNRVSLQQIGIMQSSRQAWRPIRGLPETSVTLLRAWLFDHFLHPYPNDSEKLMLASHTGLSKNQISNWFINARVRLWKPMIEEMYKEELAELSTESDQLGVGDSADD